MTVRAAVIGRFTVLCSTALFAQDVRAPSRFVVVNHGRPAGEMRVDVRGDSTTVQFRYQDRQRGPSVQVQLTTDGARGAVRTLTVHGMTPEFIATDRRERFERDGTRARWIVGADTESVATVGSPFYLSNARRTRWRCSRGSCWRKRARRCHSCR